MISVTLPLFATQTLPLASMATPLGEFMPPPLKTVPLLPLVLISVTVLLPLVTQAMPLWSIATAVGPLSGPAVKPEAPERNPVASVAEMPRASSFETELFPAFGTQIFPEPSAAIADGVESAPPEYVMTMPKSLGKLAGKVPRAKPSR